MCCDSGQPPAQVLKQALLTQLQGPGARSARRAARATIAFNTTVKPFDNINVRKAIIAASDRNALRLTRGGKVLGRHRHRLAAAGHARLRGGRRPKQDTDLDYLKNPRATRRVAKKYMLARQEGGPQPADRRRRQVDRRARRS